MAERLPSAGVNAPGPVAPALVATLDGALHPADAPLLRPDDLGVLRGDGVFDATLVVHGRPRDLSEHLHRLVVSGEIADIAAPEPPLWQAAVDAVLAAIAAGPAADAEWMLRFVVTRGVSEAGPPTSYLLAAPLGAEMIAKRKGLRVRLLQRGFIGVEVAALPWLMPGGKTLSYGINMAAQREAHRRGDDEVLFVGSDGLLLEGPTCSALITGQTDGRPWIASPSMSGILDSITVRRLFRACRAAGWDADYRPIHPDELRSAEGAYVASSGRLLAPIEAIDGIERRIGPRTDELRALLEMP